MCGRYTVYQSHRRVGKLLGVLETPDLPFDGQRYNVAPTQFVPVVRQMDSAREMILAKWGLIPSWAKDAKIGNKLINARAETVASKPSFQSAFKSRRCLVAADGFYEWRKTNDGKRPLYIRLKNHEPFAFAGLWERWWAEDGNPVESCTIITTEPNDLMASIHNRMPVILPSESYSTWLGTNASADTLQGLLRPFPADQMEAYPVSTMVNSPANQGERLIERIEDEPAIERMPEQSRQAGRRDPTLFEM